MAQPTSRDELIDYCLKRLGQPVTAVNVDVDQLDNLVDDAIQIWKDYHFDGSQTFYYQHAITDQDITNRYLKVTDDIIGVTRIFPLTDTLTKNNMFDLRYQLRLHELYDFTSTSYTNFSITMQHLANLQQMFTGEIPIRFERHTKKLYIDAAWGSSELVAGTTLVAECVQVVDPEIYEAVWNDRFIKNYTTALFKRQWAQNMKKFKNVPLPGGIILDAQEMWNEANDEILRLETQLDKEFSVPPAFMMG